MKEVLAYAFTIAAGLLLWAMLDQQPAPRYARPRLPPATDLADEYYRHFEYDKEIAALDSMIADDPDSAAAYGNRGLAYLAKREPERAIPDFEKHMALDPITANPYSNRGIAYNIEGDYPRALADYEKAIALAPGDFHRVRDLAFLHLNHADYAAAEHDIAPIAQVRDAKTASLHYLIRARLGLDAKALLRKDAEALPDKAWPFPVVAFLLGDLSADALQAQAEDRGQQCTADYYIGEAALVAGHADAARPALTDARRICPGDYDEYYGALADLRRLPPP